MLIPLVSVAVSLTLLPATLAGIGARIDWPRLRHEGHASRTWTRWAELVVRHKLIAAALGIAVLVTLAIPVFSITTGQTGVGALTKSGSAVSAYDRLLAGGVPAGVLTPLEVLTRASAATEAKAKLAAVPGISDTPLSTAADSNRAGTTVLLGIPREPTANSRTLAPVKTSNADLREVPGVIGVAGVGAISIAYANAVFGNCRSCST
jgi:putative drug exporter of the RND superfamily